MAVFVFKAIFPVETKFTALNAGPDAGFLFSVVTQLTHALQEFIYLCAPCVVDKAMGGCCLFYCRCRLFFWFNVVDPVEIPVLFHSLLLHFSLL